MAVSSHDVQMPWTRHLASKMMRLMEDYRADVGQRLRALRESRNMSQEDAAHLVGVAVKTWHNWESGKRSPYESNWQRLADSFEIDVQPIRGTPPIPLGLGDDGDVDDPRIEKLAEMVIELDEQVRLLRAELAARDAEVLTRIDGVHRAIQDLRPLPPQ